MFTLEQLNNFAKQSCPRWNRSRLTRLAAREAYQRAAQEFWESPEHRNLIEDYRTDKNSVHAITNAYLCDHSWPVDTYPWPYCDENFAAWADEPLRGRVDVVDQGGFAIRTGISYCAWKIFEATGKWLEKKSSRQLYPKDWLKLLAKNGYSEIVEAPETGGDFVGVKTDFDGRVGYIVWFEFIDDEHCIPEIWVSSYTGGRHHAWMTTKDAFTWVKIG